MIADVETLFNAEALRWHPERGNLTRQWLCYRVGILLNQFKINQTGHFTFRTLHRRPERLHRHTRKHAFGHFAMLHHASTLHVNKFGSMEILSHSLGFVNFQLHVHQRFVVVRVGGGEWWPFSIFISFEPFFLRWICLQCAVKNKNSTNENSLGIHFQLKPIPAMGFNADEK